MNNIQNKKIIHLAEYAAPYMGNFISSLICLEEKLKEQKCEVFYVFPEVVKEMSWFDFFSKQHLSFLINGDIKKSENQLCVILKKIKPDLIHCHFDGFDISSVKAVKKLKLDTQIIWHLHNAKGITIQGWHKIIWFFRFFIHYGIYSKKVSVISVSNYMLSFSNFYHKLIFGHNYCHGEVIPNGIVISRIRQKNDYAPHLPFTFLSLGGRNNQKRIDLILDAISIVRKEGYSVKLIITDGCDTKNVVENYYKKQVPEWIELTPQKEDINELFELSDAFISSSVHETFSYAICEATIFGLPIIQSDIEGTAWNLSNPSVLSFKSLDSNDLAKKMINLLNYDNSILRSKCFITRSNNANEYSIERWCCKIINNYCKTLNSENT